MRYFLPIDVMTFKSLTKDDLMNMNDLRFPCSKEKQKNSAFLFIRNTRLRIQQDFSECSYEDKSEYLCLYMTGRITTYIQDLVETWLEILLYEYGDSIKYKSILNRDEIKRFRSENSDLIDDINKICISLPLISMEYYFNDVPMEGVNVLEDFESTDEAPINIHNFMFMLQYADFVYLTCPRDNIKPLYYTKYFANAKNDPFIYEAIQRLPYLNILNASLNGSSEYISDIVNAIDKSMENKITKKEE